MIRINIIDVSLLYLMGPLAGVIINIFCFCLKCSFYAFGDDVLLQIVLFYKMHWGLWMFIIVSICKYISQSSKANSLSISILSLYTIIKPFIQTN